MPPTAPLSCEKCDSELSPQLCEFVRNVLVPLLVERYLASQRDPDDPSDADQDLPVAA